jgi:hypothetical protein
MHIKHSRDNFFSLLMNHLDMRRNPYLCVGEIQGIIWYSSSTMKFLPSLSVVASNMVVLENFLVLVLGTAGPPPA